MSGWFKFWELFFKLKDIISKSFFFFFFLLLLFLLLSFNLEGGEIFLFCFLISWFSSFLKKKKKSIPPTYIWVLKLFKIFSFVLFSSIDFWKLFIILILIFSGFFIFVSDKKLLISFSADAMCELSFLLIISLWIFSIDSSVFIV